MSTLRVEGIRNASASSDAITLATDGTCTAKITNNLSHRNLIINGSIICAERGSSSTTSSTASGFGTIDRWDCRHNGNDEAPTHSQHALTSSDAGPWEKGFRYSYHMQNGNQTGGAGATDYNFIFQSIEAQNLAGSGWHYTSTSSYITLSFWVKASVAQNYYGYMRTIDGTEQSIPFETGTLTANVWKYVTVTVSGNSNITVDNDNNLGMRIYWAPFIGTDYTDNSKTVGAWSPYVNGQRFPDMASTWYTTNDATFEITGVQLEVGSKATDYEHRTFGDELIRCQRYYNRVFDMKGQSGEKPASLAVYENGSIVTTIFNFSEMRDVPSLDITNGSNKFMIRRQDGSDSFDTMSLRYGTKTTAELTVSSNVSGNSGIVGMLRGADTDVYIAFNSEI